MVCSYAKSDGSLCSLWPTGGRNRSLSSANQLVWPYRHREIAWPFATSATAASKSSVPMANGCSPSASVVPSAATSSSPSASLWTKRVSGLNKQATFCEKLVNLYLRNVIFTWYSWLGRENGSFSVVKIILLCSIELMMNWSVVWSPAFASAPAFLSIDCQPPARSIPITQ